MAVPVRVPLLSSLLPQSILSPNAKCSPRELSSLPPRNLCTGGATPRARWCSAVAQGGAAQVRGRALAQHLARWCRADDSWCPECCAAPRTMAPESMLRPRPFVCPYGSRGCRNPFSPQVFAAGTFFAAAHCCTSRRLSCAFATHLARWCPECVCYHRARPGALKVLADNPFSPQKLSVRRGNFLCRPETSVREACHPAQDGASQLRALAQAQSCRRACAPHLERGARSTMVPQRMLRSRSSVCPYAKCSPEEPSLSAQNLSYMGLISRSSVCPYAKCSPEEPSLSAQNLSYVGLI